MNALIVNKTKRVFKEKNIYDQEEKGFKKLIRDKFFISGLILYIAKGSKKSRVVSFMSKDENLIFIMKNWLKKYVNTEVGMKKDREYIILRVSGVDNWRKVLAWQKLLIQYYNKVLKNE